MIGQWATAHAGLPAAVGLGTDGARDIDLVADGPHALVGGTTGAGKSQLLRTWVAAMALRSSPEAVTFVLVDYKGGSAFTECAALPHTVAVVSDLDERLTIRALTSLQAEVKRRERLLADAGAADLSSYESLRGHRPRLPRLVIVVDEFKMLADELPDFVNGLVRLAAVGRSLGLHLILATQRPGGIVTGDMRANIALRVALRVRDQSDSRDVIDVPDAADIPAGTPGRALVRGADGTLYELQAADTSAPPSVPEARPTVTVHAVGPDGAVDLPFGEPAPARPSPRQHDELADSQLGAAVEAMRSAARRLGLAPPRSPWLPALPQRLRLPDRPDPDDGVVLGLADDPAHQRQYPWAWDLTAGGHLGVGGSSRSGRTNALRVAVLACARTHSPDAVHIHVLTPRPQEWADLMALPHLGTVSGTDDPFTAARTIARLLREEVAPQVQRIVVIDGWEPVERSLERVAFDDAAHDPRTLLTEGLGRGIRVAVSGERSVLSGAVSALVGTRIALALNDPTDLMLAGVPASAAPSCRAPGRAVDLRSHDELQVYALDDAAAATVVTSVGDRWAQPVHRPWRHRPLPMAVRLTDLRAATGPGDPEQGWVIGVAGDEHEVCRLPPGPDCCRFVISGPRGSGRSTALATLLHEAVAAGRSVVVVARRRSALTELAVHHGIAVLDPLNPQDTQAYIARRATTPDLVVLVDEAPTTTGSPLEPALLETADRAGAAGGFLAASLDAERDGTGSPLVRRLSVDGSGIMLWPDRHDRADLLGARPDPSGVRVPGRGAFIEGGRSRPLQVALPA